MQQPITRIMTIDMGHRIPKHESKCRNVHGHTYKIEVTIDGKIHDEGAQEGMVLDFGFLKGAMTKIIEDRFDHAFCLSVSDEVLLRAFYCKDVFFDSWMIEIQECIAQVGMATEMTPIGKIVVLPYAPTAENLAMFWFGELSDTLEERHHVKLISVKVWETPNCFAEYKI